MKMIKCKENKFEKQKTERNTRKTGNYLLGWNVGKLDQIISGYEKKKNNNYCH